jgi:predicted alpha/beta superfamily hydrolase
MKPTSTPCVRRLFAAFVTLAAVIAAPLSRAADAASAAAPARASTAGPGVHVLPTPFAMPGLGRERTVRLYLPPSYATQPGRRYLVIYMHDAQNLFDDATSFVGEWGVDETLDELARTRGFEAIVVGIDHGGEERTHELSPWANPKYGAAQGEQYMAFVVDTLKPWIDAHYRTRPGRESTAIVGSSMGALVSHYALLRYPQVFGKAAIFSPSYWFSDEVYAQTKAHPWPVGTRTWFYVGGHESDETVPDVERMLALLAAQPHAVGDIRLHVEPAAEHNERAWRAEFPRAVAWLFALPEATRASAAP